MFKNIAVKIFFLLCVLPLLLHTTPSFDILKQEFLAEKEDSLKIIYFNKLYRKYSSTGSYDTALYYGNAALQLATKSNHLKNMIDSYNNIGIAYYNQSNYKKALQNFYTSLRLIQSNNEENIEWKKIETKAYNNIGIIYEAQANYEIALQNYFASLKIQKEINNKYGVASSYNNIGNVYNALANYDEAIKNHLASLELRKEIGDKQGVAASYNNIGIVYGAKANYHKALENFLASLKIQTELGEKQSLPISYNNIANVYASKLEYEKAISWFQNGLRLANDVGTKRWVMDSYKGLSDVNEKIGNYKSAYQYYQLYSQVKDSIFNKESNQQIAEIQIKYETEKKESKIKLLDNENKVKSLQIAEQQHRLYNNRILFITLVGFITLIIAIGWLLFSKNKIKQKEFLKTELLKQQELRTNIIIETQEKERKRIAQDLHDGICQTIARIKINFVTIINKSPFDADESKNTQQQIIKSLDDAYKEIRVLSHQMMPKALQEGGLADAMSDLLEKTVANLNIKYTFEKDNIIRLNEHIEVGLYRIFQELLNNILKHANATEIEVYLHKTEAQIILMVEDNGVGIKQNKAETKGIGLSNIEARTHALNGFFSINAGAKQGTVAVIRIPNKQ